MQGNIFFDQLAELVGQQERQLKMESAMAPGGMAPEISLPNPAGNVVSLSSLRGKYVLIDFWASWCKPCRIENPNVVKLYNKYRSKNFEIYGVSLDKSKEQWEQAIREDGLQWIHVSDLRFWQSAAAQLYNITSIPHTVLVDPEGRIVAKNLRGQQLENTLAELLGS
jgi:peroxiredoxin